MRNRTYGIFSASKRRLFLKSRGGASAVEFAIIAPVFFALAFSIIEAGYFFFINSAVDAATLKAARLVRTGQVQENAIDKNAFFAEICNIVDLFGDCSSQLTVDVQRFSSFTDLSADIAAPICRNASRADLSSIPYNTGDPRDIVRVRICYLHKTINPALGIKLEETDGSEKKIIATSIFRNEPFGN